MDNDNNDNHQIQMDNDNNDNHRIQMDNDNNDNHQIQMVYESNEALYEIPNITTFFQGTVKLSNGDRQCKATGKIWTNDGKRKRKNKNKTAKNSEKEFNHFKCPWCDKSIEIGSIKPHSLRHLDRKEYICRICELIMNGNDEQRKMKVQLKSYKFNTKKDLVQHHNKHKTGQKGKFQCKLCNRKFDWKCSLKRHQENQHKQGILYDIDVYCNH